VQRLRWASEDRVILKKKEINSYLTESRNQILEKWRRIKDV